MTSVAPGWYTDSDDPALIRWWDGDTWTDHTQPNPAAAPAVDMSAYPPPDSAAPTADQSPAPSSSTAVPMPAPSAPVPPPFAEPPAPDLAVPPTADAVPSRRDTRASGSPSIPVSAPVKLVPPTSNSFPISEPVRLVPPTAPPQEAPSGWSGAEPPAPSWAGADASASPAPPRPDESGTFAVTPLATVPPAPASAGTPWTSSSTFAQPTGSVDLASVDYEPMVRTWGSARGGTSTRTVTGVTTSGAWMLALSPLLQLGLFALGWLLTDGATNSSTPIIGAALGAALLAWVLVATILDFRRLGALGHEYRPSVLWILVGPFMYLIARAIHVLRTTGKGVAPTWVYLGLSIIVGAALGAASLALPRDASLTELRQVESQIAADLRQQGLEVSVFCPTEATLTVGSTFVCTAYDEIGPVSLLRVTYGGVPGSFTYQVESSSAGS